MAELFKKPKAPEAVMAPSKDDERQRLVAQSELGKGGGRSSTILTQGLAVPLPRGPETRAPKSVITSF